MLIKLTEFDKDPIIVNTDAIIYVRPCKNKEYEAKSIVFLQENEEYDSWLYVKESINEILTKVSTTSLF